MNENVRLKIALQKGGRLSKQSLTLLEQCGLLFNIQPSQLISPCINFPIDLLFVRDDDIPQLVSDGVSDLGIVGENVLFESLSMRQNKFVASIALNFCRCRLAIAVPKLQPYFGVQSLVGKRIATSYPNLLRTFLDENNIAADIAEINGSVELAPAIGMADAICDLVSTGKTLAQNNLNEVQMVLESQAVLIQSNQQRSARLQSIFNDLLLEVTAVIDGQTKAEVSA